MKITTIIHFPQGDLRMEMEDIPPVILRCPHCKEEYLVSVEDRREAILAVQSYNAHYRECVVRGKALG